MLCVEAGVFNNLPTAILLRTVITLTAFLLQESYLEHTNCKGAAEKEKAMAKGQERSSYWEGQRNDFISPANQLSRGLCKCQRV